MTKEQIIEVIDKLVGGIRPIGESNYDAKAKKNLEMMIEIVGNYVDEICDIALTNPCRMASVEKCQKTADEFIRGLKDAYESLDSEV